MCERKSEVLNKLLCLKFVWYVPTRQKACLVGLVILSLPSFSNQRAVSDGEFQ